jgi:hypothetical protein
MNDTPPSSPLLTSSCRTLDTLLNFFKFYKSLNDEVSSRLTVFISSFDITEPNPSLRKVLEKILEQTKEKLVFHLEFAQ